LRLWPVSLLQVYARISTSRFFFAKVSYPAPPTPPRVAVMCFVLPTADKLHSSFNCFLFRAAWTRRLTVFFPVPIHHPPPPQKPSRLFFFPVLRERVTFGCFSRHHPEWAAKTFPPRIFSSREDFRDFPCRFLLPPLTNRRFRGYTLLLLEAPPPFS